MQGAFYRNLLCSVKPNYHRILDGRRRVINNSYIIDIYIKLSIFAIIL
jgi:hypothetical protein